jgi:hypothetical protein
MQKHLSHLASLAIGVSLVASAGYAGEPVPLFLTSTGASNEGFTDPDKSRQDAVKNLTEALGKKKDVKLVSNREEAVIVLEVLGRGVREDSGKMTQMFGGKHEVKMLRVKLSAGDFAAELSGESAGGGMKGGPGRSAWTKAAYKVADQVEKWIQENEAQLTKRKESPAAAGVAPTTPTPSASPSPQ